MPDDPQLEALKLPPHSLEAEQSILGGLLLDTAATRGSATSLPTVSATSSPKTISTATPIA